MNSKKNTSLKLIRVPPDCILVNEKWRGSKLGQELCQKHGGIMSSELSVVDFYPADKTGVLYFTTSDYANKEYKKKLKGFFDVCKTRGLVLADRNSSNIEDYSVIQDFATFSMNLSVIPVVGPQEVPDILKELSYIESRSPDNPFKGRQKNLDLTSTQISLLTLIPNLGRKKTEELLKKFGHVRGICDASEDELSKCVGVATAKQVYRFFHQKINS